jgi:hypothetical protein
MQTSEPGSAEWVRINIKDRECREFFLKYYEAKPVK